jgi:hypothetical protein
MHPAVVARRRRRFAPHALDAAVIEATTPTTMPANRAGFAAKLAVIAGGGIGIDSAHAALPSTASAARLRYRPATHSRRQLGQQSKASGSAVRFAAMLARAKVTRMA